MLCDDGWVEGSAGSPQNQPNTMFLPDFTFCLAKLQEQRVTQLSEKKGISFQICNNNLFCIEILHLRETQAIFIFLGPFFKKTNKIKTNKNNSTRLTLEISQIFFCEREKRCLYFSYFCPMFVFAYFRNKEFPHFPLAWMYFCLSTCYCR